jgi:hypothetical protein
MLNIYISPVLVLAAAECVYVLLVLADLFSPAMQRASMPTIARYLSSASPLPGVGWCRSARFVLPARSSHLPRAAGEHRLRDA